MSAEALRHTGLLADHQVMGQMVAHELVHHAQDVAIGGDHRWVTLLPHLHGIGDLARDHIAEGHARWADQRVTEIVFGTVIDDAQAPRSHRYKRRAAFPLVRAIRANKQRAYSEGAAFFREVDTELHQVNRIWSRPELGPNQAEIAHPHQWLARVGAS